MLGIVILNYNTWNESCSCVKSIIEYASIEYKIYFIDNNSTKKPTISELEYLEKNTIVKINSENRGFSAGNNAGLQLAMEDDCDAYMICNSDVIFVDNTIDRMYAKLVDNNDYGVVGPLIYNRKKEPTNIYMLEKETLSGKYISILSNTILKKFFKRQLNKKSILCDKIENDLKVFTVSGCCFMISKECMKFLYPLDETPFLYMEELIIGCRLEETDFLAVVIPHTKIIHMHGISTKGVANPFSYIRCLESEIYYFSRYMHVSLIQVIPFVILRYCRYLYRCISNKSYRDNFGNMNYLIKKAIKKWF